MRVLCVAEKPSISKSITQILSGGRFDTHSTGSVFIKNYEFDYPQTNSNFIVTCVSGHLTEHDFGEAHRKWHSCNPAELFDAPVESRVAKDKKAIEQNLMAQARRADTLMIWTDCDREGEHIGMEIVGVCRKAKPNIVVKRARFSAIIAQQIHRAAQHPVELDQAQADAVEARILLDLKVGAAFTRMQTLSLQPQFRVLSENIVSYGPCQFPTLGFVVQKYNQVKNFVPEVFWYIHLTHVSNTSDGPQETRFNWSRGHIFDEPAASAIYEHVMQSQGARVGRNIMARVTKVTNKDTKKWKPLPLTTVELQKAGSRLLRMAPKKVLDVAEKLYQQGFLSYPRTETDQFDPQFDFMSLIHKQTIDPAWGNFARSLEQGGFSTPRKGKHDDNAHPPIHPTAHAGGLTGDEKKVYEYVARRFLACCSKDAEGWQTTVEVVCNGELFSASGLVILQRNYLDVYPYDKWSDHPLPEFKEGDQFLPASLELRNGETTKPHLLTEADLVTLMDKNGIGTDATIAQHIQNIIDREYVIERMEGQTKYLVPSTLGVALVEGYDKIGLDRSVSKPQLRRETERRMVQVCQRSVTKQDMLWQSLQQYKEMFRHVKDNWGTVVQSVRQYLEGDGGNGAVGPGNLGGPGNGGGGDGGNGGGGGGNGGGRGGRGGRGGDAGGGRGSRGGRGGRGAGGSSAPTSKRGRGGRAGGTNTVVPQVPDFDMDDDPDWMSTLDNPQSGPTARQVQPKTTSKSTTTASRVTMAPPATPPYPSSSSTARWTPSSSAIASSSPNPNPAQGVLCSCGLPAAKTTVQSGVNSAGKPCYVCVTKTCGFWEFADNVDSSLGMSRGIGSSSNGASSSTVVPAKRTYTQTGDDPTKPARICKCGVDGILRTCRKEGEHYGRLFWKCRNWQKEGDCDFFEWDDEPPRSAGAIGSSGGGGGGGGGALGSGKCFNCDQEGHWSKDCPTRSKRPRSFGTSTNDAAANVTCYRCNATGHLATSCPQQSMSRSKSSGSNYGGGSGGNSGDAPCFNCGKSGHWSNACPNGTSSYGGRGGGRGVSTRGSKRGRGRGSNSSTTTTKRRGRGGKKSSFAAADGY